MRVTEDLSLDMLQLLLEFSASSNISVANTLSLVSREVQSWTDPYLFKYVIVSESSSNEVSQSRRHLENMCASGASDRLVRARTHVRVIAWQYGSELALIRRCLPVLPKLEQLCLWSAVYRHPNDMSDCCPSLRKVCLGMTLGHYPGFEVRDPFNSSFWTFVTHLQIQLVFGHLKGTDLLQSTLFDGLRSVTHLALEFFVPHQEDNIENSLTNVRNALPSTLKLCVLGMRIEAHKLTPEVLAHLDKARNGGVDGLIVFWSHPWESWGEILCPGRDGRKSAWELWCGLEDGEKTLWDMGEEVLDARKRGKTV